MTVGVCIVAAGRRAHLSRALHSLTKQHRAPEQIVVVALDDEPVVGAPGIGVEIVRWHVPAGSPLPIGAARNLGAARLTTDALVMLDVDCIAAPDLVARYDAVLRRHPAALACGPVRYLRRQWQHGVDASDSSALDERSAAPVGRPLPPQGETWIDDVHHDLFWSLSFGVARPLWDRLGGFDERFVGYGAEDTDLAWRARRLGVPLAWFEGGTAYHQWHLPARHDRARVPELVANAHLFRERWGRWPMSGWLTDLDRRGWVRFDADAGVLVAT